MDDLGDEEIEPLPFEANLIPYLGGYVVIPPAVQRARIAYARIDMVEVQGVITFRNELCHNLSG